MDSDSQTPTAETTPPPKRHPGLPPRVRRTKPRAEGEAPPKPKPSVLGFTIYRRKCLGCHALVITPDHTCWFCARCRKRAQNE